MSKICVPGSNLFVSSMWLNFATFLQVEKEKKLEKSLFIFRLGRIEWKEGGTKLHGVSLLLRNA